MLNRLRSRLSAPLVISMLALFAALGGVAGALPGKNTVNSGDVKKNSLKGVDIKESTLNIPQQALPESVQKVYGFTWLGGSLYRSTLDGVTAEGNAGTTTYTFPFDVTQCSPVATGIFSDGVTALQAGTAPTNRNKVIVHTGTTPDHQLVLVCP
jgi:hypothetical protein